MQASRQTQKLLCLSLPHHRSDWSEVSFRKSHTNSSKIDWTRISEFCERTIKK